MLDCLLLIKMEYEFSMNVIKKKFIKEYISLFVFLCSVLLCLFTELKWMHLIWVFKPDWLFYTIEKHELGLKVFLCVIAPIKTYIVLIYVSHLFKKIKGLKQMNTMAKIRFTVVLFLLICLIFSVMFIQDNLFSYESISGILYPVYK